MRTLTTHETYDILTTKLRNHKKVYYSCFGDGDFNIMRMMGDKLHIPSKELQTESIESFMIDHDCYRIGAMVNYDVESGMRDGLFAPPSDNTQIESFIINTLGFSNSHVFDSHVMFRYFMAFYPNIFVQFLDEFVRPRRKLFIGSVSKDDAEKLIGNIDYYIQVPARDAYYSIDYWYPKVLDSIGDVDVCIPTIGMAGRVLQMRLWKLGIDVHSIEIGSTIDAAAGSVSRTWIRICNHENIKKCLLKNEKTYRNII